MVHLHLHLQCLTPKQTLRLTPSTAVHNTTLPRHVKLQHIKGIAIILADSVSRLKAEDLYYGFDIQHS